MIALAHDLGVAEFFRFICDYLYKFSDRLADV